MPAARAYCVSAWARTHGIEAELLAPGLGVLLGLVEQQRQLRGDAPRP